jgi:hypothetical protein
MRSILICSAALLAFSLPLHADTLTVPPPMMWTAVPCADWNCVMTELTVSNGDRDVIAMPTTCRGFPWVVLKKVPAGIVDPGQEVWTVNHYTSVVEALQSFILISNDRSPLMLTTTGGALLVASLTNPPKPRAVRH